MSKNGSSGSTQTIQQSDPWSGVQPYLTGTSTRRLRQGVTPTYTQNNNTITSDAEGNLSFGGQQVQNNPESDYETVGTPGIYSEAQRLYQQNQNIPQAQTDLINQYNPTLTARNQALNNFLPQMAGVAGGSTATNFTGAGMTDAAREITPQQLNIQQARAAQGALDPTTAMQQMLGGRPDTQYLDQQAQALTQQANRNLAENIMPQIRGGAQSAGQYGGSRQGIAEGLAASRVTQDLAPALTNMYSGALENAQNRMYGTAGQLNQQAESVGTGNVSRDLQAQTQNTSNLMNQQQFNAGLQLQNQQLQMNQANQNLARQLQGLSAANQATGMQDTTFNQQMQLAGMPQQYQQQQLQNYAGIVQPGASVGGTSTSTQPLYSNPASGALAGGLLGYKLGGPVGAAIGGLGGLIFR